VAAVAEAEEERGVEEVGESRPPSGERWASSGRSLEKRGHLCVGGFGWISFFMLFSYIRLLMI
jgi:hypothetical protein